MNLEWKMLFLLARVYVLGGGSEEVFPHQLADEADEVNDPGSIFEGVEPILRHLGLLWYSGMIDLTEKRSLIITAQGKVLVEANVPRVVAYLREHPEATADEVSEAVH